MSWQSVVESSVSGLGYELVEVERTGRGLVRVTIDRIARDPRGEFIVVEDCERVTRQLQHVLEVEGLAYERLEVSSPGLDRPLRKEADFRRFAGADVALTLKAPFQGRKRFQGRLLEPDAPEGEEAAWRLLLAAEPEAAVPARRGGGHEEEGRCCAGAGGRGAVGGTRRACVRHGARVPARRGARGAPGAGGGFQGSPVPACGTAGPTGATPNDEEAAR